MKILHTSDWHLGARLGEFSRLDEQKKVLEEIRNIAEEEEIELVIIAGDVFDNFNPSNEAVELLYRELKKLAADGSRPVIVIAGNHDSPDRIEAPDPLAAECGIFFIGYPDFTRSETELDEGTVVDFPEKGILRLSFSSKPQVRILTTPYANENRLKKYLEADSRDEQISRILADSWKRLSAGYCDSSGINILTAHLFMADTGGGAGGQPGLFDPEPEEPEEERSILHPGGLERVDSALVPEQIQYAALGHLHRPQSVRKSDSPVVYSGSPLAFGLSEENQQKSVVVVEIEPGRPASVRRVQLQSGRKIMRKSFGNVDEAVAWLGENRDVYTELLIECEKYISAEDRKRLYDAGGLITAVIPVSRDTASGSSSTQNRSMPDLSESMEALFKSYFEYAKGAEPDEAILEIFREITAEGAADET